MVISREAYSCTTYLWRGVLWLQSLVLMCAPCLMSNSKISLFFPIHAICKGDFEHLFWTLTSAPCCKRTWHMDTWPVWTAIWSAEFSSPSFWLTNRMTSELFLFDCIATPGYLKLSLRAEIEKTTTVINMQGLVFPLIDKSFILRIVSTFN